MKIRTPCPTPQCRDLILYLGNLGKDGDGDSVYGVNNYWCDRRVDQVEPGHGGCPCNRITPGDYQIVLPGAKRQQSVRRHPPEAEPAKPVRKGGFDMERASRPAGVTINGAPMDKKLSAWALDDMVVRLRDINGATKRHMQQAKGMTAKEIGCTTSELERMLVRYNSGWMDELWKRVDEYRQTLGFDLPANPADEEKEEPMRRSIDWGISVEAYPEIFRDPLPGESLEQYMVRVLPEVPTRLNGMLKWLEETFEIRRTSSGASFVRMWRRHPELDPLPDGIMPGTRPHRSSNSKIDWHSSAPDNFPERIGEETLAMTVGRILRGDVNKFEDVAGRLQTAFGLQRIHGARHSLEKFCKDKGILIPDGIRSGTRTRTGGRKKQGGTEEKPPAPPALPPHPAPAPLGPPPSPPTPARAPLPTLTVGRLEPLMIEDPSTLYQLLIAVVFDGNGSPDDAKRLALRMVAEHGLGRDLSAFAAGLFLAKQEATPTTGQ